MSLLQNQFDEYQTTHISEIPTYTSESDIELFWGEIHVEDYAMTLDCAF
jgi:hypothetical protein